MKWNYRVFSKKINGRTYYYLKETYYNDSGEIDSVLEEPETGYWNSVKELRDSLEMMLNDVNKYESRILNEDDIFKC